MNTHQGSTNESTIGAVVATIAAMQHKHYLAGMLLILLAATLLRLPQLDSLPPGVHYDEAANGLLAAEIGLAGERPVFIPSYTGKEVLFFYAAGGVMRLVGVSTFSLRLTAVFLSLLTIAATYSLGCELLRNRRLALLAAGLLAVSFWHLLFSRLGFRAIAQPLLQALMVAAWLRGWRTGQRRWLLLSGVCLGLTAYTYLAARLFPVLLLLAGIPLLNRRRWRDHLLVVGVAFVVVLPLLLYFWQHPDAFWVRITQVSPDGASLGAANGGSGLSIWHSYGRSLQMFFLQGDPYIRFNLPGRPLFNWLWGGFGVIGMGVLLSEWRTLRADWQRTAVLLLLLAPFIMILPTALAVNEIVPSNLRAIGLIPFVFYLPAIGFLWSAQQIRLDIAHWLALTAAWALLTTAVITQRDYFENWGTKAALFYETDADLGAVAHLLDSLAMTDETVYVASPHYQHPTVAFLSERYERVKWLPQSEALVFPDEGSALYLFPAKSPVPDWVKPLLATAVVSDTLLGPDGQAAAIAYQLNQPPPLTISHEVNANFGNAITLLGYDAAGTAAGTALGLTLYWQINGRPPGDFAPFVHLEDAWRYRWSQVETFAYPAAQWAAGEWVVQRVDVPVPQGTPVGDYQLRIGLFDGASGNRLARFDDNGRYAGDTFVIAGVPITVGVPQPPLPAPPVALNDTVTDGLRLLGTAVLPATLSTGEALPTTAWWYAASGLPALQTRYEMLKVGEVGGRIIGTVQPVHNTYPFINWATPQLVIDRQLLSLPEDLAPGEYAVRLRVLDGADETLYARLIGNVTVEKTAREFALPQTAQQPQAVFGDEIVLAGADLVAHGARRFTLTLAWQALTPPSADYTVFVHVLTPNGRCDPCAWQMDAMPRQNQYPTSRWLANEVVVDSYDFMLPEELPLDTYPIEVGLYLAESGVRLQVVQPDAANGDVVFLAPILLQE